MSCHVSWHWFYFAELQRADVHSDLVSIWCDSVFEGRRSTLTVAWRIGLHCSLLHWCSSSKYLNLLDCERKSVYFQLCNVFYAWGAFLWNKSCRSPSLTGSPFPAEQRRATNCQEKCVLSLPRKRHNWVQSHSVFLFVGQVSGVVISAWGSNFTETKQRSYLTPCRFPPS